jgi:hypothetical protein
MSMYSRFCYVLAVLTIPFFLGIGLLTQSRSAQAAGSNHEIDALPALSQTATVAPRTFTPTPSFTDTPTASRTNTALPSDDVLIMGQIVDVCSGKGLVGVQIYVGFGADPLIPATVTDANGYYFRELGGTGGVQQTVIVLPYLNNWNFGPQNFSWTHTPGSVETRTINFYSGYRRIGWPTPSASDPIMDSAHCLSTPTATQILSPRTTPTPDSGLNIVLEGYIYDKMTRLPIRGAMVGWSISCFPHAAITAPTDAAGFFYLSVPGWYACGSVMITANGYSSYNDPTSIDSLYANPVRNYYLQRAAPKP